MRFKAETCRSEYNGYQIVQYVDNTKVYERHVTAGKMHRIKLNVKFNKLSVHALTIYFTSLNDERHV
jgi:hypothetical protein